MLQWRTPHYVPMNFNSWRQWVIKLIKKIKLGKRHIGVLWEDLEEVVVGGYRQKTLYECISFKE